MSSVADETSRRPHDAEASRRDLLAAAAELFDERGYDGATLRDIGERAGVDAALVARYFGGKEGLYLAALAQAQPTDFPTDPAGLIRAMLCTPDHKRTSPVQRALVSPALSETVRDQVRAVLRTRLLDRLAAVLEAQGAEHAALRADLLLALMIGVSLTRSNGTLEALADVGDEELLAVLAPVAEALAGTASPAPSP